MLTALPQVNCGGNWTWARTPATPQVDLVFHPSGADKTRTSLVLGKGVRDSRPATTTEGEACHARACDPHVTNYYARALHLLRLDQRGDYATKMDKSRARKVEKNEGSGRSICINR